MSCDQRHKWLRPGWRSRVNSLHRLPTGYKGSENRLATGAAWDNSCLERYRSACKRLWAKSREQPDVYWKTD